MKSIKLAMIITASALVSVQPVSVLAAKNTDFVVVNEELGIPVFPYDITDKPYKIIGPVKAGVRKATIFSKEPSQEKIYNELWERGEKMEADAIVNATYGDSHMSAMSWGKTNALAFAVKFLTAEEIAAGERGETAPAPTEYNEEMFKDANKALSK